MQIKQSNLIKLIIAATDLTLITVAFHAAYYIRFGSMDNVENFVWLYYFSAPLIVVIMFHRGVFDGFRYKRLRDIYLNTILSLAMSGLICSAMLYLTKTAEYSRLVFGLYFTIAALLLLLEKIVLKRVFDRYLMRGMGSVRIAMIGCGAKFDHILSELLKRPQWGIVPVLKINSSQLDVRSVVKQIRNSVIDEVYIAYPRQTVYYEQLADLIDALENFGIPIRVALNFDELQSYYGQHPCKMADTEGVMLAPHNLDPDQMIVKRAMDISGSILGLIMLAVMFPIIALAIRADSPGPIVFSQYRIGKGGRSFRMYKFRSMYVDAEEKKDELLEYNVHEGPIFKMENDPRITTVGRILRKYSIDEAPQFWNVLRGEMSLVGTRPPTIEEVEKYEDHHFRRISIKPGVTGLWQVSGRNKICRFEEIVAMDVEYIRNWSLWSDLQIIFKTISIVFKPGKGPSQ